MTTSHPQNLVLAAGAGGREVLAVAVLAVEAALLLHEAAHHQRGVAVVAGELLGVPRHAHRDEEGTPGGERGKKQDEKPKQEVIYCLKQIGSCCRFMKQHRWLHFSGNLFSPL